MTAEGNKVADDLEKALEGLSHMAEADTAKEMRIRDARLSGSYPMRPGVATTTAPTPPMERLEQAAEAAQMTLAEMRSFTDFILGGGLATEPNDGAKPPTGVLPVVAYRADQITDCIVEIRKLIERMRSAA